jgi:hypothetical protein
VVKEEGNACQSLHSIVVEESTMLATLLAKTQTQYSRQKQKIDSVLGASKAKQSKAKQSKAKQSKAKGSKAWRHEYQDNLIT